MSFVFDTLYDQRAMVTLYRAVGKMRPNRKRQVLRVLCGLMALAMAGVGVTLWSREGASPVAVLQIVLGVLVMGGVLLLTQYQAASSLRRLPGGRLRFTATFDEEGYMVSNRGQGPRERYEDVWAVCETERYLLVMLDGAHAHLLDKNGLSGGSLEEFKRFLTEKTGKSIRQL